MKTKTQIVSSRNSRRPNTLIEHYRSDGGYRKHANTPSARKRCAVCKELDAEKTLGYTVGAFRDWYLGGLIPVVYRQVRHADGKVKRYAVWISPSTYNCRRSEVLKVARNAARVLGYKTTN